MLHRIRFSRNHQLQFFTGYQRAVFVILAGVQHHPANSGKLANFALAIQTGTLFVELLQKLINLLVSSVLPVFGD